MKIRSSLQAGGRYYTIREDDTLSGLAYRFYGDASFSNVMKIYLKNIATIGSNPNFIVVGQTIWIPD